MTTRNRPDGLRGSRTLGVPLIGELGGGVGQASSLLWDGIRRAWPGDSELVSLLEHGNRHPGLVAKLRFGRRLAAKQLLGSARWIFFSHLGLARAERFVPPPFRVPYAVFLHGIESWHAMSAEEVGTLQGATLRVANSDLTARRVVGANPAVGPVLVCPLALADGEEHAGDRQSTTPVEGRRSVLVVGRMSQRERYKGHQELIDVWPDVRAAVPDAELVIAGDGDDRPRLEARAQASRAANGIRFVGFVDRAELAALYARAALFALPSRGEGFGLVYLEAMAHRVPCLGSPHDAAGEVIEDGQTGLLVDPLDPNALGRAIVGLLRNDDLRRRMGQSGYERLNARFTFAHFNRRLIRLLEDSLEPAAIGQRAVHAWARTP